MGKYQSPNDFHQDYQNTPFYMDMPYQPIITNTIYVEHLGRTITTLQAMERKGNKKLWHIDDSISNATSIGNILFYLSTNDLLRAVNIDSGEVLFETSIKPSIEFFNLDKMVQHDGYYLCADEQQGHLYMILGDSRQIFAFSVIQ